MSQNYFYISFRVYVVTMLYQASLQQQLLEAQQTIIALQKRIDKMTPKVMPDEDVFWHVASGGILSNDAANSDDPKMVRRFKQWNVDFARKNIKPYVNPLVYGECVNQMTRGLGERIVELETAKRQEKKQQTNEHLKLVRDSPKQTPSRVEQMALIPN